MNINPWNFVANLKYMGMGMLGIIAVMGIIIIITLLLSRMTREKEQ